MLINLQRWISLRKLANAFTFFLRPGPHRDCGALPCSIKQEKVWSPVAVAGRTDSKISAQHKHKISRMHRSGSVTQGMPALE